MNRHLLTSEMAVGETLKPAVMDAARVAEIQSACEAVASYANWYRAVPAHPAVAEYRAARFAQFIEALKALKGIVND